MGNRVTTECTMRQHLDARLSAMKYELVKWMIGAVGAATITLMVTIIRFAKP